MSFLTFIEQKTLLKLLTNLNEVILILIYLIFNLLLHLITHYKLGNLYTYRYIHASVYLQYTKLYIFSYKSRCSKLK